MVVSRHSGSKSTPKHAISSFPEILKSTFRLSWSPSSVISPLLVVSFLSRLLTCPGKPLFILHILYIRDGLSPFLLDPGTLEDTSFYIGRLHLFSAWVFTFLFQFLGPSIYIYPSSYQVFRAVVTRIPCTYTYVDTSWSIPTLVFFFTLATPGLVATSTIVQVQFCASSPFDCPSS